MNSLLAVLYAVAFLANAAAAIFWGVREKRAREELLRAKEAQIDLLRELTSTKVFEHFRDTKTLLEDSIRAKDSEIRALKDENISRNQLAERLEEIRNSLQVQLHVSEQTWKSDLRRLAVAQRIEDLIYPLDLGLLEELLTDAGLSEAEARETISKVVTLPRDWPIYRVRSEVRALLMERLAIHQDRE